jgi:pimeloyl-ACP methyl ester carboxylesterase
MPGRTEKHVYCPAERSCISLEAAMRLAKLAGLVFSLLIVGCLPDAEGPTAPAHTSNVGSRIEQHGPPAPQDFGPDTRRTGVFTGQGVTRAGLSCGASSARGRVCEGFLPSGVDGTLLDVTIMVPRGGGLHPLVVLLHGWGGSKSSLGDEADALLNDGYAVLRYSTRGFGRSWGQVNLADVHVEIADLRSMIGQVIDQRGFRLDGDAVAVAGASYGGGQSWLALIGTSFQSPRGSAVRIRTVVPIATWSDLLYSLIPNGRPEYSLEPAGSPKLSYVNALYLSGIRAMPDRP